MIIEVYKLLIQVTINPNYTSARSTIFLTAALVAAVTNRAMGSNDRGRSIIRAQIPRIK